MKNELIKKKLTEVLELAVLENEPTVQVVILALLGAYTSGDDGLFASEVQKIVKEVMLPKLMKDRFDDIARQN